MNIDHVNKSIVENYRKLRTRMGLLALVFPIVVVAAGLRWGIGLQPTLSDYYFAKDPVGARIDIYPVRLWFCGVLAIVGFFLWKYAGFSKNEDRWLNAAGSFVLGVAVFPMALGGHSDFNPFAWIGLPQVSPHGVSAVLAFLCIAVVIFWFADETLSELKKTDEAAYRRFRNIYRGIALYMALSITTSVTLHYLNQKQGSWILIAEASGIWAFAAYWFVKNRELTEVKKAMKLRKMTDAVGPATVPAAARVDVVDAL